jgi:hypothetical protein
MEELGLAHGDGRLAKLMLGYVRRARALDQLLQALSGSTMT